MLKHAHRVIGKHTQSYIEKTRTNTRQPRCFWCNHILRNKHAAKMLFLVQKSHKPFFGPLRPPSNIHFIQSYRIPNPGKIQNNSMCNVKKNLTIALSSGFEKFTLCQNPVTSFFSKMNLLKKSFNPPDSRLR